LIIQNWSKFEELMQIHFGRFIRFSKFLKRGARRVSRAIDFAQAAGADLRDDTVMRERRVGSQLLIHRNRTGRPSDYGGRKMKLAWVE
jgi:hypothetical protein